MGRPSRLRVLAAVLAAPGALVLLALAGGGPLVAASRPVASAGSDAAGGAYTAVIPVRLLDTRSSDQMLSPGGSINLTVVGTDGAPATATAVALNLTVTDTTASGYLSAYPAGAARPTVSNLDWSAGETVANSAIVPVGTGGQISIYNHTGHTDVVVDLDGYFSPMTPGGATGAYVPLAPARIADTRPGSGFPDASSTLGPGGTLAVQVSGAGQVPAGAAAAVLNVTATDTTASSFLTVYPEGTTLPTASSLNWVAGETVANRVLAPLSSSGQISIYNHSGRADVVVDVDGYFTSGTSSLPATATLYTAITPTRVLDTRARSGYPGAGSTLGPGATLPVTYALLPTSVTAVVENLTAADTTASSYFTVYPGGGTRPTSSDLNWGPGQVVANLTVATLSGHEATEIFNHAGSSDAIVDAFGYFSLYTPAVAPTITAVTPPSGPIGTSVTITGTGFSTTDGATDFNFGPGNEATEVACSSSTTCDAIVPAGSGVVDVTATVGGLTSAISTAATFTYIAAPPPAPTSSQLQFTTEPASTADSGEPFSTSPVVEVEDSAGAVVTGDTSLVTLELSSSPGGSSTISCTGGNSVTAVGGVATFTGCAISGPTGAYTLVASDGTLNPATSSSVGLGPGSPSALGFSEEPPANSSAGASFGSQVEVSVYDAQGNLVTSDSSTVILGASSGATLSCTGGISQAAAAGVAIFSGCGLGGAPGGYTITATDGALTPATSSTVTLTAGAADMLAFAAAPPSTVAAGVEFANPVTVAVQDSAGNTVTSNTSSVTLALTGTPPGVTLTCQGGDTAAAVAGEAAFGDCEVAGTAGGYTITATDGSLTPATSGVISVTAGSPAGLLVQLQSYTQQASVAFPVTVGLQDAYGNPITSDSTSSVTLALNNADGATFSCNGTGTDGDTLQLTTGAANFSCMVATVTGGEYTIVATDATDAVTGTSAQFVVIALS